MLKRVRRGLGTLGLGSLQRHLPTFTLAVERPRPLSAPATSPAPSQAAGASTTSPARSADLLALRDGLRELLTFLDSPAPAMPEM